MDKFTVIKVCTGIAFIVSLAFIGLGGGLGWYAMNGVSLISFAISALAEGSNDSNVPPDAAVQ